MTAKKCVHLQCSLEMFNVVNLKSGLLYCCCCSFLCAFHLMKFNETSVQQRKILYKTLDRCSLHIQQQFLLLDSSIDITQHGNAFMKYILNTMYARVSTMYARVSTMYAMHTMYVCILHTHIF